MTRLPPFRVHRQYVPPPMDEHEFELEKLKLAMRSESAKLRDARIQWFVTLIWPPVSNALIAYVAATGVVGAAAKQATEIKTELTATNKGQDEKLTAIVGGVDAGVRSWKAYQTKEPEDMNAAAVAVETAERLIEPVAPTKVEARP